MVYRAQQLKIEKEKLKEDFDAKVFEEANKEKWNKMGEEEK